MRPRTGAPGLRGAAAGASAVPGAELDAPVQLGQALDISPPNLAVILDRMAECGWVERVRSTRDRRAQHVHLTAKGRALAERSRKISATMEEAALAALSRAERALLIELLRKI